MGSARVDERKQILQHLMNPNVSRIVIFGESGMGKTFLAREIADHAIDGICFETIWLSLNRTHDERSVYETMAHKLSVLPNYEEIDPEDDGSKEEKEKIEDLKIKIAREMGRKMGSGEKKKSSEDAEKMFLLVVLDDEGKKTSEDHVMIQFGLREFLEQYRVPWKVLITRRTEDGSSVRVKGQETIELVSLNVEASFGLFNSFLGEEVSSELGLDVSSIARKSNGVPVGITVLAKSLSYVTRKKSSKSLSPLLTRVFRRNGLLVNERAEEEEEEADSAEEIVRSQRFSMGITGCDLLLLLSYATLTSDVAVNCLWHSLKYFEKFGGLYYRDLMNHCILEGCFDPIKSSETTYKDGHNVQMELLERGMLKIQEDSMVVPEERMRIVFNLHPRSHSGQTSLRLVEVTYDGDEIYLEKTAQIDDMIKTVTSKKISTLLVSGNRLRREIPRQFFEKMQDLKVVGLFSPALDSLMQSIIVLQKLRVLVIRDCNVLENIDPIADLETLNALEISGASALKGKLNDCLFRKMAHLQSLNISSSPLIEYLPSSLSVLKELRYLILRDCPSLKCLPDLQFMENLEVIDTCGSTSVSVSEAEHHNTNFFRLKNLQRLDFSCTKLVRLPLFQCNGLKWSGYLEALTHLVLRDCIELSRLPSLKPLSGLEVLDLSGCVGIVEIKNACFEEKKKLRIIDLSGTSITALPPAFTELSSLREMILRDCLSLASLPKLDGLTSLEVLDASNCRNMTEIAGSFEFMSHLEKLALSGTRVTSLPAFPKASKLRYLLLKGCSSLKRLPTSKESLTLQNLEFLNLSGCQELENLPELIHSRNLKVINCSGCSALEINAESLTSVPRLRDLDLSGTKIKKASDLPKNCNDLSHLSLQNCADLEDVTGLEHFSKLQELNLHSIKCLNGGKAELLQHLTNLESLNLSGVHLSEFSTISKLNNLRYLSLTIDRESSAAELLPLLKCLNHLEVLSLSGTSITAEFLSSIQDSLRVKRLVLPDLSMLRELNRSKFAMQGSVKEISWEDHGGFVPFGTVITNAKPSLNVGRTELLQLMENKADKLKNICFEELNVSVCLKKQCSNQGASCPRELYGYEESFLKIRDEPFLEIHGCDGSGNFPDLIKTWLSKAEYISFVDNLSTSCSSIFSASQVKAAKGILVQRCVKMENLFRGEDWEATASQIQRLEALQISSLPNLTNICSRTELPTNMFQNLKQLSLECCPKIEGSVFQAPHVPRGLEILQIKFCDNLKRVFDEERELPRLHTLILFCLPELVAVGAKLEGLQLYRVQKCPNLKDTEESLRGTKTS